MIATWLFVFASILIKTETVGVDFCGLKRLHGASLRFRHKLD